MAPRVLAGIVNVNSPTVNDEIHAPMGGVRDSGWGGTGLRSLEDFSNVIRINSHSGQRQYRSDITSEFQHEQRSERRTAI